MVGSTSLLFLVRVLDGVSVSLTAAVGRVFTINTSVLKNGLPILGAIKSRDSRSFVRNNILVPWSAGGSINQWTQSGGEKRGNNSSKQCIGGIRRRPTSKTEAGSRLLRLRAHPEHAGKDR